MKIPNMGNMGQFMKMAQKMQKDMKIAQQELSSSEFTGVAGGEMVTIVLQGDYKVKDVKIDPEVLQDADVDTVQDLIQAAFMDALEQIEAKKASLFKGVPPGLI